jgi:hypothetical protein
MRISLDSVPLWAAVLPLGGYLAMLGWLHLRRRPVVVAGTWDLTALAVAVLGLVVAGPLALVQPVLGTAPWSVAMLLVVFVLVVAAGVLAMRPRLVIYNVTVEQLRPVLAEVVGRLDASARWAGESVVLPARGIQLLVDGHGLARSVSVVAVGRRTSGEAWSEFSRRLRRALRSLPVRRNPWGAALAAAGLGIVAAALGWAVAVRLPPAAPQAGGLVPLSVSLTPESPHARARRSLGP